MRLTFRQGIARYQTDVYATPAFLAKSSQNGEFIDLIVSPDPTILVFAHKNATYVVEESRTVSRAWGPFATAQVATRHLYWDINLLDAGLTRGFTTLPPIVAGSAPVNPANDQHWFDTTAQQFKVWNGSKWVDKVRLFAATYSSQAIIQPYPLGSQVGQNGSFEAGSLVLDAYNKPLRQSDGSFVTSTTELSIINAATRKVKFETEVVHGMASEFIPRFSFVQVRPGRKLALARSDQWRSRIVGIVSEDLHQSEVGIVQPSGLITNDQWAWPASFVGRPVFCGLTGQVTVEPPAIGVSQVAGYIYDRDSIYINIQQVTILTDLSAETFEPAGPAAPTGQAPVAEFFVSPVVGTVPLTVTATSTSLHNPTSYAWDFKVDGTVDSTAEVATYTFTAPGTYGIKLLVSNGFGSDEEIKTQVITVNAAQATGTNTNLGVQLIGPLQVAKGQEFTVTFTTDNDGLRAATRVGRGLTISDIGVNHVTVSGLPAGATAQRLNQTLIVTFPEVPTLLTGRSVSASFTVRAPQAVGTIKLRALVASPEHDSTLGDNIAELSVKVK